MIQTDVDHNFLGIGNFCRNEEIPADVHLRFETIGHILGDIFADIFQLNEFHDFSIHFIDVGLIFPQVSSQNIFNEAFDLLSRFCRVCSSDLIRIDTVIYWHGLAVFIDDSDRNGIYSKKIEVI